MQNEMKPYLFTLLLSTLSISVVAEKYVVGAQDIDYYPQYDFTSNQDKGVGWAILEAFSEQSEHEFFYLSMPVRRLQMEMVKGNVDFVYPDNPRWYNPVTQTTDKTFSIPLVESLSATFVKPENVGKGIDAVQRLAFPLGFTPVKWQARINAKLVEIVSVTDTYTGLSMLHLDRINAIEIEYHVSEHFTRVYPQLGPFTLDVRLPHNSVPFQLSTIHHPTLISELNHFIQNNPDTIKNIFERYHIQSPKALVEAFRLAQGVEEKDLWRSR